ncbi:hypothetical protein BGZ98_008673 [Dissophora globulifera]|nr:hypothetical protein BGZ98_008673 [Dissophora globulifera]
MSHPPPLPSRSLQLDNDLTPITTVALATSSLPTTTTTRAHAMASTNSVPAPHHAAGSASAPSSPPGSSNVPVATTAAQTPNSSTKPTHSSSGVSNGSASGNNGLFNRNPSIRIKVDKRSKGKDGTKDKDRAKYRDKDEVFSDPHSKVFLKRSRSPIKLLKNIKSYLHVHKHKYSSNLAGGSQFSPSTHSSSTFQPHQPQSLNSSSTNYTSHSNSLAPPHSSIDGHAYRSATFPSSSIVSASSLPQDEIQGRVFKDRQSEALSPEKQVLLLQVVSYFEHAGHRADEETAEYLLSSYQWNIDHTMQYCQDLIQAVQGSLVPVRQEIQLGGAVNDQMTSCYIDSLLFAMFARLSAFEGLLNVNLDAESDSDSDSGGEVARVDPRREEEKQDALLHTHLLQTWLRMFVNQLRSGRLIQAHVVKELRQHLYSCGWNPPGPNDPPGCSRQEDSSELFMFLTEKLHLPYLPLEQRLLHGAKTSADDDKVITERMLQIAIPTPELDLETTPASPTNKLESAFSKLMSKPSPNLSNGTEGSNNVGSAYEVLSLEKLLAQHFYDNTLVGIRRLVSSGTGVPLSPGVEIPVSAWQVLELLPFYSSSNEQGGIIHASQSQYPADVVILPLILKRYAFGADMQTRRIGTPIDIPRRIDFSRFVNRQTQFSAPPTGDVKDSSIFKDSKSDGNVENANYAVSHLQVPAPPLSSGLSPSASDLAFHPDNVPSIGASSSVHSISSLSINTRPPQNRKYSMSLLQAADSPLTPPPQYSPGTPTRPPLQTLGDDKRGWSPNPPADEMYGGDYMDYGQPKVKYMLELKSVVCHIGSRLDSGHYRSYVADRVGKSATGAGTQGVTGSTTSHPLSFQEPNWLRHDDLDPSGQRVTLIPRDSIEDMDMESDWARNGYILFYELQTIQS